MPGAASDATPLPPMKPQPSPPSGAPGTTLRCGLSLAVPQPSRRRYSLVVVAVTDAKVAPPVTVRFGVLFRETDEPVFGLVIVTDGPPAVATPTAITNTRPAIPRTSAFALVISGFLLPLSSG